MSISFERCNCHASWGSGVVDLSILENQQYKIYCTLHIKMVIIKFVEHFDRVTALARAVEVDPIIHDDWTIT